jgi:hypothetical protein
VRRPIEFGCCLDFDPDNSWSVGFSGRVDPDEIDLVAAE